MNLHDYDPDKDAGPVPSPCSNVCQMNRTTGLCEGCHRTLDEIARWSTADEADKRRIWKELRRREEALFDGGAPAPAAPAPAPAKPSTAGLRLFNFKR